MTWQLVGAEGKVQRFVNSDNLRQFRDAISQIRRYDPNRTVSDAGDLRVEHPLCSATGKADHIQIAGKVELRPSVDVFVAGSWVPFSRSIKSSDNASVRQWMYDLVAVKFDATGKWSFTFVAPANGRYRLRLNLVTKQRTRVQTYTAKSGGAIYMAEWGRLSFNWRDMVKDVATVVPTDDGIEIISAPVNLSALEAFTWDPSFSDDADWGAECDSTTKFPADGTDWCGAAGAYRVGNKFDITTLPDTATVDQVDFQINVVAVTSATTLTWDIDGYNGTGQGNPETDSGATMFAGCDVTGVYLNDDTQFRTTGSKTFTNLGATANSDMEAARDAAAIFTVAIREVTGGAGRSEFAEYDDADPPTLTITYTEAGGTAVKTSSDRGSSPLRDREE